MNGKGQHGRFKNIPLRGKTQIKMIFSPKILQDMSLSEIVLVQFADFIAHYKQKHHLILCFPYFGSDHFPVWLKNDSHKTK